MIGPSLLGREREALERVARAGALERVEQHPPPHPGERPQDAQHRTQSQSSATGARRVAADQLDEQLFERALAAARPTRSSSMRPCATIRPSAITPMCVDSRSTISRMCEVRKMVPPRATNDVQQVLDLPRRHRVDAFERLVEEEQPRRRQQRRRQRQLLAHAVREVGDQRRRRRPSRSISVEQIRRARLRASRRRCRGPAATKLSVSRAVSRSNSARSSGTTPMRRLTATGSASGSMPRMRIDPAGRPQQAGQALDGRATCRRRSGPRKP